MQYKIYWPVISAPQVFVAVSYQLHITSLDKITNASDTLADSLTNKPRQVNKIFATCQQSLTVVGLKTSHFILLNLNCFYLSGMDLKFWMKHTHAMLKEFRNIRQRQNSNQINWDCWFTSYWIRKANVSEWGINNSCYHCANQQFKLIKSKLCPSCPFNITKHCQCWYTCTFKLRHYQNGQITYHTEVT